MGGIPPGQYTRHMVCAGDITYKNYIHMKNVSKAVLVILVIAIGLVILRRVDAPYTIIQWVEDGQLETIKVPHDSVKSFVLKLENEDLVYWVN